MRILIIILLFVNSSYCQAWKSSFVNLPGVSNDQGPTGRTFRDTVITMTLSEYKALVSPSTQVKAQVQEIPMQSFALGLEAFANGAGFLKNVTDKSVSPKDLIKAVRLVDKEIQKKKREYEKGKRTEEDYLLYRRNLLSIKIQPER